MWRLTATSSAAASAGLSASIPSAAAMLMALMRRMDSVIFLVVSLRLRTEGFADILSVQGVRLAGVS